MQGKDQDKLSAGISGKAFLAVGAWGASFVATRIALRSFDPFALVATRLVIGAAILALVIRVAGGRLLPVRGDGVRCVVLGLVCGGHLLIQAFGLQYTTAINTAWIIGFIPVTIAIGARLLGRQYLDRRGWLGVLLGAVGVLLVTMERPPDFSRARFGDLLQLVSCFTWTVYTLGAIGPVARNGALRVTAVTMGVAAVVLAAGTALTGSGFGGFAWRPVVAVVFLGVFCSGLAYYCWVKAVEDTGPASAGAVLYFEPFVTLVIAVAVLSEPVGVATLAGGAFVLLGVRLVSRGSRHRSRGP